MRKYNYYSKSHYYRKRKQIGCSDSIPESPSCNNYVLNISHQSQTNKEETSESEKEEVNLMLEESEANSNSDLSSNEESFENSDRPKIQKDLAEFIVRNNISRNVTDELLKILNNNGVKNVPICAKTLLCTPKEPIAPVIVEPGHYYHFGIQNYFSKNESNFVKNLDIISIDIGIDGLPLFRASSQLKLWPILGAIVYAKNVRPFLIGSYVGYKQPASSSEYLKQFASEIQELQTSGVYVGVENKRKILKVRLFSCDAPAKAFITGVVGHSAKEGCSKCNQIGKKYLSSGIIYSETVGTERTDESFKKRRDIGHNQTLFRNTPSILETIGIGMVSQFPVEPMHLVDIGVVKKIMNLMIKGNCYGGKINSDLISGKLLSFRNYIPKEFQRLPRSLDDINFWKSTEFRQYLLYTGIVALYLNVESRIYNHFLTLHCAIRILSCEKTCKSNIHIAEKLLQNFVSNFSSLYGNEKLSYNVHNLLHVSDSVKQFGSLDSFSAYKFENYMQYLKRKIHRPNKVLEQLNNRIEEEYALLRPIISNSRYKFDKFEINTKRMADKYCLINPGKPMMVTKFVVESGVSYLFGHICENVTSFFTIPMDSHELGIITYKNLQQAEEKVLVSDLVYKYFRLPYEDSFILIPMIQDSFISFNSK